MKSDLIQYGVKLAKSKSKNLDKAREIKEKNLKNLVEER